VSTRLADPVTWRALVRNAALVVLALIAAAGAPNALIGR
jgi:hypothetical protein